MLCFFEVGALGCRFLRGVSFPRESCSIRRGVFQFPRNQPGGAATGGLAIIVEDHNGARCRFLQAIDFGVRIGELGAGLFHFTRIGRDWRGLYSGSLFLGGGELSLEILVFSLR